MNLVAHLFVLSAFLLSAVTVANAQQLVDFEDIPLGTNGFDNGSDGDGGFLSGGAFFHNTFDDSFGFDFWTGTAISDINDTNTAGFLNQYAVFSGTGRGGSGQYGVIFDNADDDFVTLSGPSLVNGFYVNNTTYAALVMRDGDSVFGLDPFGGPSGTEPDTFKLTVEGRDAGGVSQGTVDFYLGDYRGSNDTIVDDWSFVDLTPLGGEVESLHFELESTDTFMEFNNTPNYFALDDLSFQAKAVTNCALSGVVWNDLSNDGDPANENLEVLGFPGVEVQLLNTNGVVLGSTFSSTNGAYCLDPEPGDYIVSVIIPEIGLNGLGIASTPTEYPVTVVQGETRDDLNFGGLEIPCQSIQTVAGVVWSDLDNDGTFDRDSLDVLGIPGARILETNSDGTGAREVGITNSNGAFFVEVQVCSRLMVEVPTNFNGGRFSVPIPSYSVFDVVFNGSMFAAFPVVPDALAVEMVRSEALVRDDGVEVSWQTGVELDHLGFRVLWAAQEGAEPALLNPGSLILAKGSGSGATYSFVHEGADGSGTYFLEDLSTDLTITRQDAFLAARSAPPHADEAVVLIASENDHAAFVSTDGNSFVTGFSAVPDVWDRTDQPHVRLLGELVEIDSGFGVYLGLPAGRDIEVLTVD